MKNLFFKKDTFNRVSEPWMLSLSKIGHGGLFSDFEHGFRSSCSTPDLLAVVADRIARTFIINGATLAVVLDISNAFCRVGIVFFGKCMSYGISSEVFCLISFFLRKKWLQMIQDGKFLQ